MTRRLFLAPATSGSSSTSNGGVGRVITITGAITSADDTLLVATGAGPVTLTLPAASSVGGQRFTIKKMDSSVNLLTVIRSGADTIDGAVSLAWLIQYQAYTLQSVFAGTYGWIII